MQDSPTLYDLFDETSLHNCQRMLRKGEIPTAAQLAGILEANADQSLPDWFVELIIRSLRGELKRKAGRPKASFLSQFQFWAAAAEYEAWRRWLTKREKAFGLTGWSILHGQDWWSGPPHERAARIVIKRWRLPMDWRSFLNRLSSQKWRAYYPE